MSGTGTKRGSGSVGNLLLHLPLGGDARDASGNDHHAVNHGVDLATGTFDGFSSFLEVPDCPALRLGRNDFTFAAWVHTDDKPDDIVGSVIDKFDSNCRRGVTLSIGSSAGGYQGPGDDRQVHFGIDDARTTGWVDCGRPNPASNYVSNSLTVFDGDLYAATIGANDPADWGRVYRYAGGSEWIDCGRVGSGKTEGVMSLIVHNGSLFAATTTYDWTRVMDGGFEPGRVYRYLGDQQWEDCGEPAAHLTQNGAASYRGRLYVGGGPLEPSVASSTGDGRWSIVQRFARFGPTRCFPHAMMRYHGKLYVGFPGIYAFDGSTWRFAGLPAGGPHELLQTHSMHVYRGELYAGTWPDGIVSKYLGDERWETCGRVGEHGTEVCGLVVYNGKLYGGSIPCAEVCRYDGDATWTSLVRFYSPEGWIPEPVRNEQGEPPSRDGINAWSRVTSLTVHDGRLFAGTASCTSSVLDAPCDVRGKVFAMDAGRCASYGKDVGPGWRHLVAMRRAGRLVLYVDGRAVATSRTFPADDFDLSNHEPLRIGFGQTDYFKGRVRDVRLYRGALDNAACEQLASQPPESAS